MIDFSKIYCRHHPGETVINFCTQSDCCQGLCPTCLCEHTQEHMIKGTLPKYENIRDTYTRVHEMIQSQQRIITSDMNRLTKIFSSIKEKKENFRQILQSAKEECLNYVSECFDEFGQHWQKEIQTSEKRAGLQDRYKLDTLSALIKREMERLVDETKSMNTLGFQEKIKRLESQVLVQSSNFHKNISSELSQNEQYDYNLAFNKDQLSNLKESIKKIVKLELKMPIRRISCSMPSSPEKRQLNHSISNFRSNQNKDSRISLGSQRESGVINVGSVSKRINPMDIGFASPSQRMPNSNIFTIPKVLTTSLLQKRPTQELKITPNPSPLQLKRTSQVNTIPQYTYGVDLNKFTRQDTVESLKNQGKKKSGLMLMTPKVNDSLILKDKENTIK